MAKKNGKDIEVKKSKSVPVSAEKKAPSTAQKKAGHGITKKTQQKQQKEENLESSGEKAPLEVPLKQDKEYISQLLEILEKTYHGVETALTHRNPFEMLVATILSAQTTDKQVNKATPSLFAKYPTPREMAKASVEELIEMINTVGYYRSKAAHLKEMAEMLVEKYHGEVPKTLEELTELPGVGRKTANVVLGSAFGTAVGVVVDTHVHRLSHRLGLTREKTPEKIEKDLMKLIPQDCWIWFSHALIWHGRQICTARKPNCPGCPLNEICPSAFTF